MGKDKEYINLKEKINRINLFILNKFKDRLFKYYEKNHLEKNINYLKQTKNNDNILKFFSTYPPKIQNNKNILLFGMNPASGDIDRLDIEKSFVEISTKNDKFIYYFPYEDDNGILDNYIYKKYFKPNYELFNNKKVKLFWENKEYIESNWYTKEEFLLLNKNNIKNKFSLIFTDLFFFKETTQHLMVKIIDSDKIILKNIKELFFMQLYYYRPTLVVITNAKASDYISSFIGNNLNNPNFRYKNIDFIFSGMVSGGVTDKYNCRRLKNDIEKKLN